MSISPISAATQPQASSAAGGATKASSTNLDYDAFLQLLVTEMKNQDPLNPAESTEYIAQFATFANVEQSIQTNSRLESMLAVSALTQADALIGRTVTTFDGATSGTVASIRAVDGGVQATLDTGSQVMLGNGVQVS